MPTFRKSTRKNKKYDVFYNNKWISFGNVNYNHYRDVTGLNVYSHLDHNDPKRRAAYRARHSKILLKDGTPAYKNKNQPSYWSYYYLW